LWQCRGEGERGGGIVLTILKLFPLEYQSLLVYRYVYFVTDTGFEIFHSAKQLAFYRKRLPGKGLNINVTKGTFQA
jgi:hypothetical protein